MYSSLQMTCNFAEVYSFHHIFQFLRIMGKKNKKINTSQKQQTEEQLLKTGETTSRISEYPVKAVEQKQRDQPSSQDKSKHKQSQRNKGDHNLHHRDHHHKSHTHRQANSENSKNQTYFTWEEVGRHDHKDDLWLVIEDGVYNLTKVVDKHPGGSRVIALRAGRKADKAFIAGNHPSRVMEKTLPQFRIGSVKDDSMIQTWQREVKTGRMDSFVALLLTALILGFMAYMMV